jgi:hypothetical protein
MEMNYFSFYCHCSHYEGSEMSSGAENGCKCGSNCTCDPYAAANEQRWTKAQTKQSGCYLLDYTNKTEQEAGMYCWV